MDEIDMPQLGTVGRRRGRVRSEPERARVRARIEERMQELMVEGHHASAALKIAKAEEQARWDREQLEQEVAEVIQDQLMAQQVGREAIDAEARERLDKFSPQVDKDGEGSETDETAADRIDASLPDGVSDVEETEVQRIAKEILSKDDVVSDGRRKLPSLAMTWGDLPKEGEKKEWSKLEAESEPWYQAFMVYLHLPPLERGVGAAYRSWSKLVGRTRATKGAVPQDWYRAAQKYAWEARAIEYDKTKTQRFVQKMETAEEVIEDEMKDALMTALRKCVERLKTGRLDDIPMGSAIREIPELVKEIRDYLGLMQRNKVSLDAILQAFPPVYRQQILLAINVGPVAVDGQGVERAYDGSHIRSRPLTDLTLKERTLEAELRELEEIESGLHEDKPGDSDGN